jgi:hypothetical protein
MIRERIEQETKDDLEAILKKHGLRPTSKLIFCDNSGKVNFQVNGIEALAGTPCNFRRMENAVRAAEAELKEALEEKYEFLRVSIPANWYEQSGNNC